MSIVDFWGAPGRGQAGLHDASGLTWYTATGGKAAACRGVRESDCAVVLRRIVAVRI